MTNIPICPHDLKSDGEIFRSESKSVQRDPT